MNIILSIKPKYAELIYSGKKTVEWRHTYPEKIIFCDRIYMYETAPVYRVTGYFRINPLLTPFSFDDEFNILPRSILDDLEEWGQVSIEELKKYAARGKVWGWHILNPRRLPSPINLKWFDLKRPPQSWQYLTTNKEVTK